MRAMRVAEIKDKAIGPGTREDPQPGLGQALIRVQAAGLNGADRAQVAGFYPPPPRRASPATSPAWSWRAKWSPRPPPFPASSPARG